MNKENFENFLIVVGNLVWISMLWYAVFILDHSGWWFALVFLFHFRHRKETKTTAKNQDCPECHNDGSACTDPFGIHKNQQV